MNSEDATQSKMQLRNEEEYSTLLEADRAAAPDRLLFVTKGAILASVCTQTVVYAVLRRMYKLIEKRSGEAVSDNTILLASEAIKLFLASAGAILTESVSFHSVLSTAWPMFLPAVCYMIMNMLALHAFQFVDIVTFVTLMQLKLLTTIVWRRALLGKGVSAAKASSLILLTLSAALVAMTGEAEVEEEEAKAGAKAGFLKGVLFLLLEVAISGLMSVYSEAILKNGDVGIWTRNVQLSALSYAALFLTVVSEIKKRPFDDYDGLFGTRVNPVLTALTLDDIWTCPSPLPLLIAVMGSLGGLFVAFSLKLSDAVAKTVATSASVALMALCDFFVFDEVLGGCACIGVLMTITSVSQYALF